MTDKTKFARALSDLNDTTNSFLDRNSIVEISRGSKSYRTTLGKIDETIIGRFDLYNNLNDIFNSTKHLNDTYFSKPTKFNKNPFVEETDDAAYRSSKDMLMTRHDVDNYFSAVGVCVPIYNPSATYKYYNADEKTWKSDTITRSKQPAVLSNTLDGIWTSDSQVRFEFGNMLYYYTPDIKTAKSSMINITGNIVLDMEYKDTWFTKQHYFVALTIDGKIITMTFLKNILKIKDNDGNDYVIGQFHFNCPVAADTKFKIITNAKCKLFGVPEERKFTRKLYDSLNAVNLSFYDSW